MNISATPGSSFYTLSSNQTDLIAADESNFTHDVHSSLLAFLPATHDTSRASCHLKSLSKFVEILDQSAKRSFPNVTLSQTRYSSVQVLLLQWAEVDLNVEPEVANLNRVFKDYGFETTRWSIPTENAHRKLMLKVGEFVEAYDQKDCLMIVYYGGHAFINEARQTTWSCTRDRHFSSLDWSAVQTLFESATSDVLLLLDCCAAASSAPKGGKTMTETIAACGWESIAAEPGPFSFTSALIEVLQEWINRKFSVAMLHSKMLSVLKHERPERFDSGPRIECRRTPVYIVTTEDPSMPSIVLQRMKSALYSEETGPSQKRMREDDSEVISGTTNAPKRRKGTKLHNPKAHPSPPNDQISFTPGLSTSSTERGDVGNIDNASQVPSPPEEYGASGEALLGKESNGSLKIPHVLISVALQENQTLDAEACSTWLASFPALAQYVKVQSIYRSYSTLMIVSIPVVVWDTMPNDPACNFVGYVCSDNIFTGNDELANKSITVGLMAGVSEVPKLEATPARDIVKNYNQTSTNKSVSRSPSLTRSLSIRRSVSPATGHITQYQLGDPMGYMGSYSITSPLSDTPQPASPPALKPALPPAKKSRTNTPWTPAEEQRLQTMRDAGNSWANIAKTFPSRTEGSVKKHWYKDMQYVEFNEHESQALLKAIKESEADKWKIIGKAIGKPAKACEQFAKEHFAEKV